MTVKELLERIDSREITEWKAYFALKNEEFEANSDRRATEIAVHRRW